MTPGARQNTDLRIAKSIEAPASPFILAIVGFLLAFPQQRVFGNLSLLDLIVAAIVVRDIVGGNVRIRHSPKLSLLLGIIVAGLLLGTLRSVSVTNSVTQIAQWAFLAVFTLPFCYRYVRDDRALRIVVNGAMFALVPVFFYGLIEVFIRPLPYPSYRYSSLYGDPQVAGFTLAVWIPLLVWRATQGSGRVSGRVLRVAAGPLAIGQIWFIARTLSRTGVIAAFIGFVVFWFAANRHRGWFRSTSRVTFVVAVVVVGTGLFLQSSDSGRIVERVDDTRLGSSEVTDRTDGYAEVFSLLDPTYFVIGAGADNAHLVSARGQKPHDAFLVMLVEGGALAALAYGVIIISTLRSALARLSGSSVENVGSGLAATTGAVSAGLVVLTLNTPVLFRPMWYAIGFSLALMSTRARPVGRRLH